MHKGDLNMDNKKSSNSFGKILIVLFILALLGSCSNYEDDYRDVLESGQQKYYSGQSMTKEEYNAVKNFNKWKANQGSKTYDDWNR